MPYVPSLPRLPTFLRTLWLRERAKEFHAVDVFYLTCLLWHCKPYSFSASVHFRPNFERHSNSHVVCSKVSASGYKSCSCSVLYRLEFPSTSLFLFRFYNIFSNTLAHHLQISYNLCSLHISLQINHLSITHSMLSNCSK
jgi:hypothetical protein